MYVCYLDEAGCTGALPTRNSPIQPVLVVAGVALQATEIRRLTLDFLQIKRRFYPGPHAHLTHDLDGMLIEVKGAELRKHIGQGKHHERRHAMTFLGKILGLLQTYGASLFGRIWIKGIGIPFDGKSVYTSSVQHICTSFQNLLDQNNSTGIVIADSRDPVNNSNVAHSIFTQKFKQSGDAYSRIVEMPAFGHSNNHAGLQVTDLLCSGILFPMAVQAYCRGHVESIHVRRGYSTINTRFGGVIQGLQHRFQNHDGQWQGGLWTVDSIARKSATLLFDRSASPERPDGGESAFSR